MPIDKSWIYLDRRSDEFMKGLESFIETCAHHLNTKGLIRCPCKRCENRKFESLLTMKYHIFHGGFSQKYKRWIHHGEPIVPRAVVVNDGPPRNDMADVIQDVMGEQMEVDTDLNEENLGTESRDVHDEFEELLNEVELELYPGCKNFSSLDFLAKLMHIKVKNKWTNASFDELLDLLKRSYPEGNRIPPSHYVAKNKLNKIGLGYEKIDVCKYDCALFWKEHELLQNCPVCKESRWARKKPNGKNVPHKVLRYFPLTPRLRRLYCSRHTSENMIWHSTGRAEEGTMRHPVDGSSWKKFDIRYPNFSKEPRNVRLALAADGFNPFGNMSSAHSTWPVILTTYNLPPWLCMKESSFMLTLLIPGPKSPGKDMDIFLRPLVDELNQLWHSGVRTKDAATNTFFTMKAVLLWTINDFPARSSLSGWSGQGYKACPTCNEDTPSYYATSKVVYVGHRRFLPHDHHWRSSLDFDGKSDYREPPREFTSTMIADQHSRLIQRLPGKHPNFGGVTTRREDFELNWSKQSIFFELEYWSSMQLKHNLDVMHIEKNVCDSVLGTLLMNDKSKDTPNARADLKKLDIRKKQWLKPKAGGKFEKPHPRYSFTASDRKLFCEFIKAVKLPDGFGSNISKRVTDNNTNITGLKSHDCHILMQRLIPVGVKGFLFRDTYTPIIDLCTFFKQLCSRTLLVEDMKKAKDAILIILCKLELIYPPAFFDIMVHLVLHLPDEAISGGPVCMRWMYPFERYMKKLKNYVRNKAKPEGCIAEGYVAEEALSFCSMYLRDVKTKFNCPDRNEDVVVEKTKLWVFQSKCRPFGGKKTGRFTPTEKRKVEWFVLDSCEEVRAYMNECKSEHPEDDVKTKFPNWFLEKLYLMKTQKSPDFHPELHALSMGVSTYNTYTACIVNGVRFMVVSRDAERATQNSGVSTTGENGEIYYGQLEEIIELFYRTGYSTVLFWCKWFDTRMGGISHENNITSISTELEWDKDDQLIFASQAKQVFYIREPSRVNQNNNHRWVVENVNHRSIWDLPINDGCVNNVENIASDLAEADLDIVHNNSSSNCTLIIDLSQYFQKTHADINEGEAATEVDPTLATVNQVSDDETDEDEDSGDYDTEGSERGTEEYEEESD